LSSDTTLLLLWRGGASAIFSAIEQSLVMRWGWWRYLVVLSRFEKRGEKGLEGGASAIFSAIERSLAMRWGWWQYLVVLSRFEEGVIWGRA